MTTPSPGRRRPWVRFALAMLISVAILLALCWKTQTKVAHVFGKLFEVNGFLLGVAFVLSAAVHILLGAYKWYLTLVWSGCRTTFVETLFVRMGSDPLRAVLPFKSGELGNVAYYWRTGKLTFGESLSWMAFDKATNIAGTFFWLVIGLAVLFARRVPEAVHSQSRLIVAGSLLVAVSLGLLGAPAVSARVRRGLLRLAGRVSSKVQGFGSRLLLTFEKLSAGRKAALAALGVVFQLRPIIVCVLLFHAFGADFERQPTPAEFLASGSVVVAFSNVPLAQWGTGPREFALNLLFHTYLKPQAAQAQQEIPDIVEKALDPVAPTPTPVGAQTLIAIGLLMAVSIHFVPAFLGLPFLVQFLNALRVGRMPPINGNDDAAAGS